MSLIGLNDDDLRDLDYLLSELNRGRLVSDYSIMSFYSKSNLFNCKINEKRKISEDRIKYLFPFLLNSCASKGGNFSVHQGVFELIPDDRTSLFLLNGGFKNEYKRELEEIEKITSKENIESEKIMLEIENLKKNNKTIFWSLGISIASIIIAIGSLIFDFFKN